MIVLLILNLFLDSICGFDSSGNYGKALEGTLVIFVLYFVIIALFGNQLMPEGIPFVDKLDSYQSITFMFNDKRSVFILECTELISLTFIISLISNYIPSSFGGSSIAGKVIRCIILVLIGVIINNYFFIYCKEEYFIFLGNYGFTMFSIGNSVSDNSSYGNWKFASA